jgi:hypothetical protein
LTVFGGCDPAAAGCLLDTDEMMAGLGKAMHDSRVAIGRGGVTGAAPGAVSAARPVRSDQDTAMTPLVPSRTSLDFGIVPQGSQHCAFFELASDELIELDRIETSCECLEVTVAKRSANAAEKLLASALLELSRASDFTGVLEIEVVGMTKLEAGAFRLTVNCDVRPKSEFDGLGTDSRLLSKDSESVPVPLPMPMRGPES